MKPLNLADVTEAELGVLRELWQRASATIRELTEALYPRGGASGYGTVQKLLERLESKHYVTRDRVGPAHRFSAAIARDDLIGRRLRALAESLCEGSLVPLLSHLVNRSEGLSTTDRARLRALIDALDREPRKSGSARPSRSKSRSKP